MKINNINLHQIEIRFCTPFFQNMFINIYEHLNYFNVEFARIFENSKTFLKRKLS